MKPSVQTTFHNRFDIYKTNADTGETVQVAYAENIVLDAMWSRLCNWQSYFVNIHYGTGTGTLASTRTSLFMHLGTKTAVNDTLTKNIPTAIWRRKIVLNSEDNVGAVLTEIGVAYGATSTNLVTHAMLRDMNGNIVSITKTAVDLITIYATIYITFSTAHANMQICGLPNSNPLMNYLVGGTAIGTCYFYAGDNPDTADENTYGATISTYVLGTSPAVTWTPTVALKKTVTSTPRFSVDQANGHIKEIGFGNSQAAPIFRVLLPATGIYSGLDITGASVGTGDSLNRLFVLPSKNVKQNSVVIKVDGTPVSNYIQSEEFLSLHILQRFALSYAETKLEMSADGKAMGSAMTATHEVFPVYRRTYQKWAQVSAPSSLPGYGASDAALSADGTILSMVKGTALNVYDWNGTSYVKRTEPSVPPTGSSYGCALSADGNILAVAHATTPFISTYDWVTDAWVKRTNPAILPTGTGTGCALSPDGTVLVVSHENAPYFSVYDWTTGAWVKRANPTSLPEGNTNDCDISSDGLSVALALRVSPYIAVYDWVEGAWTKRANPMTLPTGIANACAITADGKRVAIAHEVSPYLSVYTWVQGIAVRNENSTTAMTQIGRGCDFSNDGQLAFGHASGLSEPYINFFHVNVPSTVLYFDAAPANGAVITADYTVNGIHKTTARVIDMNCTITFGEPVV